MPGTAGGSRLRLFIVGLAFLLAMAYLGVDSMFLLSGTGVTFLVTENIFWMLLYLLSAYLHYKWSKFRAVSILVAGANAGRVSRSVVDPYGNLGTAMLPVHASLLIVIMLFGLLVLWSILSESRRQG